jgi:hypothetical protein
VKISILVILAIWMGCEKSGTETVGTEGVALSLKPAITVGDPCSRTDGWQSSAGRPSAMSFAKPTAFAIGPDDLDFSQLPVRTGYCLTAGGIYPYGYYTMNCKADTDCPKGAVCYDGQQCRMVCSGDSDCKPPTRCKGDNPPFCSADVPKREAN